MDAAPADPALAKLSEEQLIDLLQETQPTVWTRAQPANPFWAIGGAVSLGGGGVELPIHSPAAIELVRRGWRALPALLDHLTDTRPTKLVYVVPKPAAESKTALAFSAEYDPRAQDSAKPREGVNTGERTPLNEEGGTYAFKVGDLCYATLGQVVNRDLRAVRCDAEDAMIFSGSRSANPGDWFMTLNSPIVRAALAAAARADWGGIDVQQHADSLRADLRRPARKQPPETGALTRLLYYYPGIGVEVAEALLRRKLVEPAAGSTGVLAPGPVEESTVGIWQQAQFVETLAPFRCDRLQAALLDLFRRAAATAVADLRAQPAGTWDPSIPSLGSDLALNCAKQLIHQGHDDELKAFFSARVASIEAADKAKDPAPGQNLGGAKFVNRVQAENCRAFIAELERTTPSTPNRPTEVDTLALAAYPNVRLGSVSLLRHTMSLTVTVEPVDPSVERIFVGRLIIDKAKDEVGVTLWQAFVPMLAPVAVGRTSEDELNGLPKAAFSAILTRPSPRAKVLVSLEGRVEMVVPDIDPDAVVLVDEIVAKFGSPLNSKALQAAEISITIHDRKTANGNAGGGLFHSGPLFGEDARLANDRIPTPQLEAGDVAVSISDPGERFLNVEFRDSDGHSLRYNHNGWSHSSGQGVRIDVYRLGQQIPSGTQMVVWLRTGKSFLVVPLKATNLPLPKETASER